MTSQVYRTQENDIRKYKLFKFFNDKTRNPAMDLVGIQKRSLATSETIELKLNRNDKINQDALFTRSFIVIGNKISDPKNGTKCHMCHFVLQSSPVY